MSFVTSCETIPFRPLDDTARIHQYHIWGKLRLFVDALAERSSTNFPLIKWARPLLCGKSDSVASLIHMCQILSLPQAVDSPEYIVIESYGNWYLFRCHSTNPLGNVIIFQWMPMSLVHPDASYYVDKEGRQSVYAEQGIATAFEIRQSTLTRLMNETQKHPYGYHGNGEINLWGFHTLPTVDEANRQHRIANILQFRMAKKVEDSGHLVANAAIMGAPLEFAIRMSYFTKHKGWKQIPIKPRDGLLTDTQRPEKPQPLSHWIKKDVCLKIHGDLGYQEMIDTLMKHAMV